VHNEEKFRNMLVKIYREEIERSYFEANRARAGN